MIYIFFVLRRSEFCHCFGNDVIMTSFVTVLFSNLHIYVEHSISYQLCMFQLSRICGSNFTGGGGGTPPPVLLWSTVFVNRMTKVSIFGVEERWEGEWRLWLRQGITMHQIFIIQLLF